MSKRWLRRWFKAPAASPATAAPTTEPAAAIPTPGPLPAIDTNGLPFGVRTATDQDYPALRHFLDEHLPGCATAMLQQGFLVLAHWQGSLCGIGQLDEAGCLALYVTEDMRQLGIGTLLFQHLEDDSRARQVRQLHGEAERSSEAFLRNMGFVFDETASRATKTLCSA